MAHKPGIPHILTVLDVVDTLKLAGVAVTATAAELNLLDGIATSVTIDLAASGTTDGMAITITVVDAAGATVAGAHALDVWISEDADGIGLTGDSASGTLTAATGAILTAFTAKKHVRVVTADTGIAVLTLVDSANPTDQYVACRAPLGSAVVVSVASGTNWEGV